MKKYKEALNSIIDSLSRNITENGKQVLLRLLWFLKEFEEIIRNEEVFKTVMIGMFESEVQVKGICWQSIIDLVKKVPSLDEVKSLKEDNEIPGTLWEYAEKIVDDLKVKEELKEVEESKLKPLLEHMDKVPL